MASRYVEGGLFISLEGGEGAGKSLQAKMLHQELTQRGYEVRLTREPGGTPAGQQLRAMLLDPNLELTPLAEVLMFAADRAVHVARWIRPALQDGAIVMCDRYSDSTRAYQGAAHRLQPEVVELICRLAEDGLTPQRTYFIDVPPSVGISRVHGRVASGSQTEVSKFDDEAMGFHDAVYAGFCGIAAAEPHRVRVIDGNCVPDVVCKAILADLEVILRQKSIAHTPNLQGDNNEL